MIRFAAALLVGAALALAPTAAASQAQPAAAQDEYTLQPGDVVRVAIWRETELSGDFVVDLHGNVTLPLLGEQRVTGVPVGEVRGLLMERYRAQLRNPSIDITPLRRVNVLGSVQRPGVYPVDPTTTLAGVIAQAGGATDEGTLERIRIVRDGQVIRERVGSGETLTSADIRSNDQVYVDRRSWLDRNSAALLTAAVTVGTSLVSTLIIVSNQNQ